MTGFKFQPLKLLLTDSKAARDANELTNDMREKMAEVSGAKVEKYKPSQLVTCHFVRNLNW
jgi:hypothetical protein